MVREGSVADFTWPWVVFEAHEMMAVPSSVLASEDAVEKMGK